jgi:hypothetical protein
LISRVGLQSPVEIGLLFWFWPQTHGAHALFWCLSLARQPSSSAPFNITEEALVYDCHVWCFIIANLHFIRNAVKMLQA